MFTVYATVCQLAGASLGENYTLQNIHIQIITLIIVDEIVFYYQILV